MKHLPPLLSCLLIASVTVLNSGAAWSSVQPNTGVSKYSTKSTHKKVQKSRSKATSHIKKAKKPNAKVKTVAQVTSSNAWSAVAENPYSPDSTAPIVAKPNPYLPGTEVATAQVINPYLPAALPATTLAMAAPVAIVPFVYSPPVVAKASAPAASPAAIETPVALLAPTPAPVAVTNIQPQHVAASTTQSTINPYLAYRVAFNQTPTTTSITNPADSLGQLFSLLQFALPSLSNTAQPYRLAFNSPGAAAVSTDGLGQIFNDLRQFLPEPHLPSPDIDILPSIKKVYPTGEKPLVVLTFKCPTELIGITPIPTKVLRWLITTGMDGINSTNLLSFNMQQVCQ